MPNQLTVKRSGIFHKSKRPPARGLQTLCSTQLLDFRKFSKLFPILILDDIFWFDLFKFLKSEASTPFLLEYMMVLGFCFFKEAN